jgi:peroxiredoxin Q/BCP
MLKQGAKAPAFTLDGDLGEVSLADLRGKVVVLYFYPKDSTPGCTREAQAFSARSKELAKLGAIVLGVSKDSVASHGRFREKYDLTVKLLSDPDLGVQKAYGAYGEKTMYGKKVMGTIRSTFVVDEKGTIARVFPSVKVDGHDEAVLAAVKEIALAAKPKAGERKQESKGSGAR